MPFAVVTPDGQWHEKGRMGWFGLVANEKEKAIGKTNFCNSSALIVTALW